MIKTTPNRSPSHLAVRRRRDRWFAAAQLLAILGILSTLLTRLTWTAWILVALFVFGFLGCGVVLFVNIRRSTRLEIEWRRTQSHHIQLDRGARLREFVESHPTTFSLLTFAIGMGLILTVVILERGT